MTNSAAPRSATPAQTSASIGELLHSLSARLDGDSPELDAQVLLGHLLGRSRAWLLAHPETTLNAAELEAVEESAVRLEQGQPLPYVLGHWEFFGLDFDLTPDVLIPRPETELLVERALAWLKASSGRRAVADVGTGSGAIAVSIAARVPDARITATDISASALAVAEGNARKHEVASRVQFIKCDLLPAGPGFDLICANLPYIPSETLRGLDVYEREPALALDGGADGLDLIRRLLDLAADRLMPGGLMLLEIEASQGMKAMSLAFDRYAEAQIHLHRDLAGRDRLLEIAL